MENNVHGFPLHWDVALLAQLTIANNVSYGIVQPGQNDPNGIAIIRVNNFNLNGLDTSEVLKVSPAIEAKFSKTRLCEGDVLLTLVGSTGQTFVVTKQYVGWNVPRAVAVIRPKNNISSHWIKICLDSTFTKNFLDSRANTTVQKTINLSDVKKIPIPIPPENERKFIENCALSLNNKISNNLTTNQTLEQMAQALFKSWFVDFDPVFDNAFDAGLSVDDFPDVLQDRALIRQQHCANAMQQGAEIALQQPTLPSAVVLQAQSPQTTQTESERIRGLFPSEFEQCDDPSVGINGWIPKGWGNTSFESLIKLIGGGTPKTDVDEYWNGDIPWFSVVDAPNDSDVFVLDTEKHVTQLGVDNSSTKVLRKNTTIISARGTVGKCALVGTPMAMNQSCYGINGNEGIADTFIYFLTRYQVSDLQKRGHGSVFNTITRETFKSINVAFSGGELTVAFERLVKPYLDKILLNNRQVTQLSKTRDVLLPKLISGELQLSEAVQSIETM